MLKPIPDSERWSRANACEVLADEAEERGDQVAMKAFAAKAAGIYWYIAQELKSRLKYGGYRPSSHFLEKYAASYGAYLLAELNYRRADDHRTYSAYQEGQRVRILAQRVFFGDCPACGVLHPQYHVIPPEFDYRGHRCS